MANAWHIRHEVFWKYFICSSWVTHINDFKVIDYNNKRSQT